MEQAVIHSPLGPLTLFAEDDHLTALVYGDYGTWSMGTMAVMTTCLSSERQSASWKRISPVSGKRFPSPSTRMERHSSAGFGRVCAISHTEG